MINKAMLIGNLGKDPETRYTQNGAAVTNFSIATTERQKDNEGQQQEQTEWHRIVTFGRLAEICGNYLSKGSLVYIEGRIQTRSWEDKDGGKRYTTEIVALNMQMLDSKGQASESQVSNQNASGQTYPGPESAPEDDVPF